jgi:hypothetical protein
MNMDMNKVIYFVAVGVLALGLQSEYRQGNFADLHRAADQADCWMNRVALSAERTLVASTSSSSFRSSLFQSSSYSYGRNLAAEKLVASTRAAEMARTQAEMMRDQARSRAECVRETIQEQVRAQAEVRRAVYQMQQELQRSQIRIVRTSVSTSN